MATNNIINNAFADNFNALNKASKNLIIGGDFGINPWQRGTTYTSVANAAYTADRFIINYVTSAVTDVSQQADSPTVAQSGIFSTSCLRVAVTTADASIAAGDFYWVQQRIEGYNFTNIAQRSFTLSFWVKATKTGIYCVSFVNTGGDQSYVAEYTINTTNTWEKKAVTVTASPSAGTWNYTNGIGLRVSFTIAAGTDSQTTPNAWQAGSFYATSNQVNGLDSNTNNFNIALVQIESGAVATPFEMKTQQEILSYCQRYYLKSFPQGTAPAQATGSILGALIYRVMNGTAVTTNGALINFPVTFRTTPSATFYNPVSANNTWYNVTTAADSGAPSLSTPTNTGQRGSNVRCNQAVGDVPGNVLAIHYQYSAEL